MYEPIRFIQLSYLTPMICFHQMTAPYGYGMHRRGRVLSFAWRIILSVFVVFFLSLKANAQKATLSAPASVKVNTPSSNVVFAGFEGKEPYTFHYTINGGPELSVTTQKGNSANVPVPTNKAGAYTYRLIRTVDGNNVVIPGGRESVTLSVNDIPTITTQPQSIVTGIGCNSSLSVVATSSETNTYQWRKDGNVIGGNSSILSLIPITATSAGAYNVTLTTASGSLISNPVNVTVNPPLVAGSHDISPITACSNYNPAALSVSGTSGGVS
ncbi:MAG: hypothetical protein EOO10_02185, partial [Chitinophagaceae bacterium]